VPNHTDRIEKQNHDQLVDKLRYTPLTERDIEKLDNPRLDEDKKPWYWGYITSAEAFVPEDPQLFAAGTPDPYAPFAFNQGIQWESYYYEDGSLFEGTMTENFPHGKGVLSVGSVGGGGLLTGATSEEIQFGDLYEGEFNMGFVHGMGKLINKDGFVYTGEFMAGVKHGCGELKDLSGYLLRIQSGLAPHESWRISRKEIETTTKKGTWLNDYFSEVADVEFRGNACSPTEIDGVVEEAEEVANKARMFRYKPDGMAQIFYQDAKGIPARSLNNPLQFPYGTMFLAPGPVSQLIPIPDDNALVDEMRRAQNLWRFIYDCYNFDPDPDPDNNFNGAIELWDKTRFEEHNNRNETRRVL
jgi:hypothetical protein